MAQTSVPRCHGGGISGGPRARTGLCKVFEAKLTAVNICLGNDQEMKSVNKKSIWGILFSSCQEQPEKVPFLGQVGLRMVTSGVT